MGPYLPGAFYLEWNYPLGLSFFAPNTLPRRQAALEGQVTQITLLKGLARQTFTESVLGPSDMGEEGQCCQPLSPVAASAGTCLCRVLPEAQKSGC